MLALLALVAIGLCGFALVATLGLLAGLVLIPIRLALLSLKLVLVGAGLLVLLAIGLPVLVVAGLPLLVLGALIWGASKLVLAA
ncbi:MAG TPA: hypothetical protein VLW17_08425 [Thermoanaerobaculaceae bacterium]|nr:hypothetical protein [Thermoanaerobaculaceae bacterium]